VTSRLSRIERVAADHDLSAFRCGKVELDYWLRRHAVASDAMDSARTFVIHRRRRVVGYYSLTMGAVRRTDPPAKLVRGLPNYPVGMVLLARLAIDETEQRSGLGALLLADALARGVAAGDAVAARLVVVDAIDEQAASFYRRFGFVAVPEHPARLYLRLKDVRATLEASRDQPTSR
jgi:GNAT superfamily N-acetyltransferase